MGTLHPELQKCELINRIVESLIVIIQEFFCIVSLDLLLISENKL